MSDHIFNQMEDLLSCTVCCEPYQEKMRHPVLLPRCGHSFCRPCIALLVRGGSVVCPSCRMDQQVDTADDLPTEFSLLAITAAQQSAKLDTCQLHDVKLSFWCRTCRTATCGECLFEDHPTHCHDVIKATRHIVEMKDAISGLANRFMETLDSRERRLYDRIFRSGKTINDGLRTICVLRKDMEEARELMKGVRKVDGLANTTKLNEAAKFLGLKWNLHDAQQCLGPAPLKDANTEQKTDDAQEKENKEEEKPKESEENVENKEVNVDKQETKEEKDGETEKVQKDEESEQEEEEEEEILTEEEIKKRHKIMRLKERLAAAAAAASAEKESKEKKQLEKDKKAVKDKAVEPEPVIPNPGMLKSWKRRTIKPPSREPSITPEPEEKPEAKPEDVKAEEAKPDDVKIEGEVKGDNSENNTDEKNDRNVATIDSKEKEMESEVTKEPKPDANNKATKDTKSKKEEKSEIAMSIEQMEKDLEEKKKELEEKRKEVEKKKAATAAKKPRGRMARNALKRAQTMDLSKRVGQQAEDDDEKPEESQNIKGLDLETGGVPKTEEQQGATKEEASGETKQEEKEQKEETKNLAEQKENKDEEKEKVGDKKEVEVQKKDEDNMFELEPEEKDRIATELMTVPSLTVVVEGRGGLMSRMQWEPQGLHIYSAVPQELPYDVLIKSSVLNALVPTKSPTVFLDIGYEQRMLGRVYITLWGHLRRAHNFLLLCTGDSGTSLRETKFFEVCCPEAPGERLKGGDYEYNNGRGGDALVEDLEFGEEYSQPMEAGMVSAGGSGHRCFDSQFLICTEGDPNRSFSCPFGLVTSGLNFLKEAVWLAVTKEIFVEECGVVLDVPRF